MRMICGLPYCSILSLLEIDRLYIGIINAITSIYWWRNSFHCVPPVVLIVCPGFASFVLMQIYWMFLWPYPFLLSQ